MGSFFFKSAKQSPNSRIDMNDALHQCSFLSWSHYNRQKTGKSYYDMVLHAMPEGRRVMIYICNDRGFSSFDALSGNLIHRHEPQKQGLAPYGMQVCQDHLIILSAAGMLQVMDMATHGILWEKEIKDAGRITPLCIGDIIIVATEMNEKTHISGKLHAFSLQTGGLLWQKDCNMVPPLQRSGDRIIVNLPNGIFAAISTKDGSIIWKFSKASSRNRIFVSDAEDGLYAAEYDTLYALERSIGKARWKFKCQTEIIADILCDGREVYVMTRDGMLYSLDRASGELIWKYNGPPVPAMCENYRILPLIHENYYVLSRNDYFVVLSSGSGKLRWNAAFTNERFISNPPPLPLPGYVFSADGADTLHLFDCKKARMIWKFSLDRNDSGIPAIAAYGSLIYFLTIDGDLFCLDLPGLLDSIGEHGGAKNIRNRLSQGTDTRQ